jgi:hypothetical protein
MKSNTWYHGHILGFDAEDVLIASRVPFSSVSQQWVRNHLAELATFEIRRNGYASARLTDPNEIVLAHPAETLMSNTVKLIYRAVPCKTGSTDCEGECLNDSA